MKRLSALALTAALSLSLILPAGAAEPTFPDVPQEHWAFPYVEEMARLGVVSGGDNGFDPEGSVSTAQLAVMLTNAFCPQILEKHGEDTGSWWAPYVNAAQEAGYLTDITASWDYFQTGAWNEKTVTAPMTRYDMAMAMWNTVVAEDMTLPTDQQREAAQRAIGDFGAIPEDYESAVVAMYALGLLSGVNDKGDFGGEGTMTRAQSCVVMQGLLNWSASGQSTGEGNADSTPAEEPETPDQEAVEEPAQPAQDTGEGSADSTPVQETEGAETQPADLVAAYEQEVFDLVNQIREENGLTPFVYNETLAQLARAHSQDMIDRDFFEHENPDGDNIDARVSAAGIRWSRVAENIAAGQRTPEEVVEAWMNSPGHRANILGQCRELGVGLALGGPYGYYWTQDFATVR